MSIDEQEYGGYKANVDLLMKDRAKVTQLFKDNEKQSKKIVRLETQMGSILRKSVGAGAVTGTGSAGLLWYVLENFM